MSETCIALLRGVNVGGHHKLPMKQLAAIVESIGGRAVRTYIQSGNVVFTASKSVVRRAAADVTCAIERQAGFSPPVVLRTVEELRRVVAGNPYLGPARTSARASRQSRRLATGERPSSSWSWPRAPGRRREELT